MTVTRVDPGAAARPARVEHADADGTDSATDCNLVVAADGLRSRIRQALWPDAPGPRYAGFTAWRGVTAKPLRLQDGSQSWGRGESVGLTQLVDGRVYWFATAILPEGAKFADERAEALRRFGGWHAPIRQVIEATSPGDVLATRRLRAASPAADVRRRAGGSARRRSPRDDSAPRAGGMPGPGGRRRARGRPGSGRRRRGAGPDPVRRGPPSPSRAAVAAVRPGRPTAGRDAAARDGAAGRVRARPAATPRCRQHGRADPLDGPRRRCSARADGDERSCSSRSSGTLISDANRAGQRGKRSPWS